ncbi:hypothetical protein ACOI1H_15155, partial [Loktanella sp. DJP18]|uniref:hypothetical protein n=1 Tax=Loktanella sp. DJP18 TaxID=3409788 RepID=UPI003BB7D8FE
KHWDTILRDNRKGLIETLGREPEGWELYLAHQQGLGGARKLLRDPNANAADLVGLEAVRLNLPRGSGVDPRTATAADLSGVWRAKYNKTSFTPSGNTASSTGATDGEGKPDLTNAYASAVMGDLSAGDREAADAAAKIVGDDTATKSSGREQERRAAVSSAASPYMAALRNSYSPEVAVVQSNPLFS